MTNPSVPALSFRSFSFAYPDGAAAAQGRRAWGDPVLSGVDLSLERGSFVLLTGATGSGKSTLLRAAKPEAAPAGRSAGEVRVFGRDVRALGPEESARAVGLVQQDPDACFVASDVAGELAFGLECLGASPRDMERSVAEVSCYFGLEPLFHRPLHELSGGQKQLVALSAAMACAPSLLLLDEPTASLDPVAEQRFLHGLFRINRELGTTVVVATHRPRPMLAYADRAFRVGEGTVREVPLSSLEAMGATLDAPGLPALPASAPAALSLDDLWVSYGRREPWVLRGASLSLAAGEVRAVVGGNGGGKSTLLRTAVGILRPRRGRVRVEAPGGVAYLPQDPRELLSAETLGADLMAWSGPCGYGEAEARAVLASFGLQGFWDRAPQELSGGQRQLAALAKVLLARARLLVCDEPTRGLDDRGRSLVARAFARAAAGGAAVLAATHDLAFARGACHSVSMVFDGRASGAEPAPAFFERSVFLRP